MNGIPLDQINELKASELERAFVTHWRQFGGDCPDPVANYVFSDKRDFELDFAWVPVKVGVECHGIRDHTSIKGALRDWEKINLEHLEYWTVFIVWSKMLERNPQDIIKMVAGFVMRRLAQTDAEARARRLMNAYADGLNCAARK